MRELNASLLALGAEKIHTTQWESYFFPPHGLPAGDGRFFVCEARVREDKIKRLHLSDSVEMNLDRNDVILETLRPNKHVIKIYLDSNDQKIVYFRCGKTGLKVEVEMVPFAKEKLVFRDEGKENSGVLLSTKARAAMNEAAKILVKLDKAANGDALPWLYARELKNTLETAVRCLNQRTIFCPQPSAAKELVNRYSTSPHQR